MGNCMSCKTDKPPSRHLNQSQPKVTANIIKNSRLINLKLSETQKFFLSTPTLHVWDNKALYKMFVNQFQENETLIVLDKRLGFGVTDLKPLLDKKRIGHATFQIFDDSKQLALIKTSYDTFPNKNLA